MFALVREEVPDPALTKVVSGDAHLSDDGQSDRNPSPNQDHDHETAFASCASLDAITVDALSACDASADGILYDQSRPTLIQCPGGMAGRVTLSGR
ncbi:MAG: hypothetical protein NTW21_16495 [Verrucomicrobia bacterium]|nr:hypothetical protein [Verrucomicrobiota bacterium]